MRNILLALVICSVSVLTGYAQTGDVCISQQAANVCRDNALLVKAQAEKIAALEESVKARDKAIEELKETNRRNVTDLTERLHKTELKLAEITGTLIGVEKQNVEQRAIIQALLPMVKKKRNAFITIF